MFYTIPGSTKKAPPLCKVDLNEDEARKRLWFIDRKDLITKDRKNFKSHSLPYAHEHEHEAVHSTQYFNWCHGVYGAFTQAAISLMASINS